MQVLAIRVAYATLAAFHLRDTYVVGMTAYYQIELTVISEEPEDWSTPGWTREVVTAVMLAALKGAGLKVTKIVFVEPEA